MILFIQTAFLGDLLLSIPTLKQLRKVYPEQKIHLVCRKGIGGLIKQMGLVDEVHDDFRGTKPTLREWHTRFKGISFDLLICPHESMRSRLLCFMTRAKNKIGYSFLGSRWIFTQSYKRPMHLPEALRQLFLLQNLSIEVSKKLLQLPEKFQVYTHIPQWASMGLYNLDMKQNMRKELCEKLHVDSSHSVIAIAPGSVWPTKRWPVDAFTQVAKTLIDEHKVVVILGSKDEKIFGDEIQRRVPEVINLCGTTSLVKLADVLAGCDALVCNDSGSMHMAAVSDTPIISIFGPTVLELGYQPWSDQFKVIEKKNLKCRPCSLHGGKTCPIGTHECMEMIHPDQVIEALGSFIDIN